MSESWPITSEVNVCRCECVTWTHFSHLTFHFDMKLSEQVLQLALERAHVLQKWEGGDKNDQVRGLLWHKTRTTIVIKLTLETLAKPVNTQTSRLPPLQLSSREQVMTGVCVERILSLLCKCLLLFTDDRMKAVISMCVCVTWCLIHTFICHAKTHVTSSLIYSTRISLYLKMTLRERSIPRCILCSGGWPLRCSPWCLSWRERRRRPASSDWHPPSGGSGCRRPRTARPPVGKHKCRRPLHI